MMLRKGFRNCGERVDGGDAKGSGGIGQGAHEFVFEFIAFRAQGINLSLCIRDFFHLFRVFFGFCCLSGYICFKFFYSSFLGISISCIFKCFFGINSILFFFFFFAVVYYARGFWLQDFVKRKTEERKFKKKR